MPLEPKPIAVVEQRIAIGELLNLAEKRHAGFAAQPIEIAFPLGQGKAAEVNAVLMKKIKGQKHQLRLIRRAHAHLPHQPVKVRATPRIDQDQFSVQDCGRRGQLAEGLGHRW
jgi:hypothetical protein